MHQLSVLESLRIEISRYVLLLLILFSADGLAAQTITVMDTKTGNPVENVAIFTSDKKTTALTNPSGKADLSGFKPNDSLWFQHASYQDLTLTMTRISRLGYVVGLNPKVLPLDEVVISAYRWEQRKSEIPNKIITISPSEIEFENPQTSADILANTNQVFVQKSQLGGGSPMIRGFSANAVLIVVDGVRMNNAIYRSGNLQNIISIDPSSISGAEVIFGPGSVIYGSDALGGVMDFQSLKPVLSVSKKAKVGGNAMLRYSSANNERAAHADISVGLKKWGFLTSISANRFDDLQMGNKRNDDYLRRQYVERVDGADEMVVNDNPRIQRFSGYDQIFVLQKVKFTPNRDVDFEYGFHYSNTSDIPRYDRLIQYDDDILKYAEWYYGPQQWMMHNLKASFLNKNGMFTNGKMTLAYQKYKEGRNSRRFGRVELRSQEEQVNIFSANLDFDKVLGEASELFYGLELIYNDIKSTATLEDIFSGSISSTATRYPDGSNDYLSAAAYLSYKYKFNKQLTGIAGLRYSYVHLRSTFDQNYYNLPYTEITLNNNALNGSLGLTYRPRESWQLNMNLASGFRAPNLDDVAKVFDSEPGNVIVPNKDLKPEYAYNLDFGVLKRFKDGITIEGSLFFTRLINAMVRRDFIFNGQDSIFYDGELSKVQALVNTSSGTLAGGSLKYTMEFAKYFTFKTSLSYAWGEDSDDYPLRHIPPLFGNTTISFRYRFLHAQVYANYNGEISNEGLAPSEQTKTYMYATDENGNPYSPSWWTLNLKSSFDINKAISIDAGIENIMNHRYRPYSSGIVSPGLNLIVAVRANF